MFSPATGLAKGSCQSGSWQRQSSPLTRTVVWNGSATAISFSRSTYQLLFVSVSVPGRGIAQASVDLQEALDVGYIKVFNYGGENADRDYGAYIKASVSGSTVTLQSIGVAFLGASPIVTVIAY